MLQVEFWENAPDEQIRFAVIVARSGDKWVFARHRERETFECPGGHREAGETPLETARRELWEETGAEDYELTPFCFYSVRDPERGGDRIYGLLCYAEIRSFGSLPPLEIEQVQLLDTFPDRWTYPLIQPKLVEQVCRETGWEFK